MSDASQLATAHYPETLDRIFVVGAPSFFPTVWEYAKRWFDPITVVSFWRFLFSFPLLGVLGWGIVSPLNGSVDWIRSTWRDGGNLETGDAICQRASLQAKTCKRKEGGKGIRRSCKERVGVLFGERFQSCLEAPIANHFLPSQQSKIFILSEKNMRSTLEQYVDLDNLPKKYGGNLDWEFGDMPALDPGIVKALDWKETVEQKGHKTLPIGPIRWEYEDENGKKGDLVAKAIGTEKGKPRRNVIAG